MKKTQLETEIADLKDSLISSEQEIGRALRKIKDLEVEKDTLKRENRRLNLQASKTRDALKSALLGSVALLEAGNATQHAEEERRRNEFRAMSSFE